MVSLPHVLIAVICLLALPLTWARVPRPLPRDQDSEASVRTERSANISHITGTSRKIQLNVNQHWVLQIHPDGAVNGTDNPAQFDYTILQRTSIGNSVITFLGVATCQFLCMDSCGLLYATRYFSDDCIFNEMIEAHHFNTYSSAKYSNEKRTLYLALTKKGLPRKVQTRAKAPLGKFTTFTNVITTNVPPPKVQDLFDRIIKKIIPNFSQIILRHHNYRHLCSYLPFPTSYESDHQKCHRQQKKKKKRKCDDEESEECAPTSRLTPAEKKKCEDGEEEEKCTRRLHMIRKKRKSRTGELEVEKVEEWTARRKRLKNERKRDSSDKNNRFIREKCLYISKSDEQAYNNCVLKKGLRKKVKLEQSANNPKTTVSDRVSEEATEVLLWQDQLSIEHSKSLRSLEETNEADVLKETNVRHENVDHHQVSSDWTTSAAEPN